MHGVGTVFGYLSWVHRQEHCCPLRFHCADEAMSKQLSRTEGQTLLYAKLGGRGL